MPPGTAPVRYRDPIFSAVTVTSNVTYGSAVNLENQTITLQLDMYQPTGDTVTSRPAIVWVHGGSFSGGDKTSPELVDEATTFSKEGYLNVSIDYRLESPGCSGTLSNCVDGDSGGRSRCADRGAFPPNQRRDLRHRPEPHRHRRLVRGCDHRAERGLFVLRGLRRRACEPRSRSRVRTSCVGTISPGDAPALDFHCTTDPLVPYQSAVNTINAAQAQGLDAFLESWDETCHVPYAEHRQQILDQSRNFLWWEMDLAHAAT